MAFELDKEYWIRLNSEPMMDHSEGWAEVDDNSLSCSGFGGIVFLLTRETSWLSAILLCTDDGSWLLVSVMDVIVSVTTPDTRSLGGES